MEISQRVVGRDMNYADIVKVWLHIEFSSSYVILYDLKFQQYLHLEKKMKCRHTACEHNADRVNRIGSMCAWPIPNSHLALYMSYKHSRHDICLVGISLNSSSTRSTISIQEPVDPNKMLSTKFQSLFIAFLVPLVNTLILDYSHSISVSFHAQNVRHSANSSITTIFAHIYYHHRHSLTTWS